MARLPPDSPGYGVHHNIAELDPLALGPIVESYGQVLLPYPRGYLGGIVLEDYGDGRGKGCPVRLEVIGQAHDPLPGGGWRQHPQGPNAYPGQGPAVGGQGSGAGRDGQAGPAIGRGQAGCLEDYP